MRVHKNTGMTDLITIQIDRKMRDRLEKLAQAMNSTESQLAIEAIRSYIDLNEWQIGEIQVALEEADAGDFATAEELRAVVEKWRGSED